MPHHCCVPGCTSNSREKTVEAISFHSFPKDRALAREWIAKIRRDVGDHFQVNEHTKVCSLHFEADAYYSGSRKRPDDKKLTTVTRQKLKGDAIPTKFFWSTPARSRRAPTVRESLPPRKRRKIDCRPSGSSGASEDNVDEASRDELQSDDDSTHQHCVCVSVLNVDKEVLKSKSDKCASLEEEVNTLKAANLQLGSHVFSFSQIEQQDKLVKYYTGFSTGLMFMACFNFLKSSAEVMRTWKGSSTTPEIWEQHGSKRGSKPKLSLIEQFFLVMVRLQLGLGEVDLAQLFKVSESPVSRNVITWLDVMYHKLHQLPIWLSWCKIATILQKMVSINPNHHRLHRVLY